MSCYSEDRLSGLTLKFSSATLGNQLHALRTNPERVTEIMRRQNFWSSVPILDGNYPALVWSHEFMVFFEETSRLRYVKRFADLAAYVLAGQQTLKVVNGSQDVIAFGSCYLENYSGKDPEDMLISNGGLVSFKFLGTSVPSVVVY
jgi:hypothetical protein